MEGQSMDQKVAMVTGASQGIGKGIARELAKAGYDIALHCSSNLNAAQETAAEIHTLGRRCEVIQTDLSLYEGIVELFSAFDRVFDRIDVLVNNAGITVGGPMLEMDIETFDKVNAIDWRGGFFCTQFAVRRMIRRDIRGSVILITSNQSTMVFGGSAVYGPVKTALQKFCKHAALEFAPYGIRVNAIAPGFTDTGHPRMGDPERTYNAIPLHRWVSPAELGKMVLYLSSPDAASLSGEEITIDGGASLLAGDAGMGYLRERADRMRRKILDEDLT